MIGEKLRQLRNSRSLTVAQLCERMGMSASTYNKYERGERDVSTDTLIRFANFYNVPADYLLDRLPPILDPLADLTSDEMEQYVLREYLKLPVSIRKGILTAMFSAFESYSQRDNAEDNDAEEELTEEIRTIWISFCRDKASAGLGEDISGESENPDRIEVVETDISRKADFAVRVDGDSMTPMFDDGDIALVTEGEADIGQIGLFEMSESGYIKKLGDGELISLNPLYDPIPIEPPMRCAGVVLGKAELPE